MLNVGIQRGFRTHDFIGSIPIRGTKDDYSKQLRLNICFKHKFRGFNASTYHPDMGEWWNGRHVILRR